MMTLALNPYRRWSCLLHIVYPLPVFGFWLLLFIVAGLLW
jgi:hypothetical protein